MPCTERYFCCKEEQFDVTSGSFYHLPELRSDCDTSSLESVLHLATYVLPPGAGFVAWKVRPMYECTSFFKDLSSEAVARCEREHKGAVCDCEETSVWDFDHFTCEATDDPCGPCRVASAVSAHPSGGKGGGLAYRAELCVRAEGKGCDVEACLRHVERRANRTYKGAEKGREGNRFWVVTKAGDEAPTRRVLGSWARGAGEDEGKGKKGQEGAGSGKANDTSPAGANATSPPGGNATAPAVASATGARELDTELLSCPSGGSSNKVGFQGGAAGLIERASEFYGILRDDYLLFARGLLEDQRKLCRDRLEAFRSRYGKGCGVSGFGAGATLDSLERLVASDAFSPAECARAAGSACLAGGSWRCNATLGPSSAKAAEACPMCAVLPCCEGSGCSACIDRAREGSIGPCEGSKDPVCREEYVCCQSVATSPFPLPGEMTMARDCQLLMGKRAGGVCALPTASERELEEGAEQACERDLAWKGVRCGCYYDAGGTLGAASHDCFALRYDPGWERVTEPDAAFGIKECRPKEEQRGLLGLVRARRGNHTVVLPPSLLECQEEAADLKDLCTADGSGALFGDNRTRSVSEAIARLDELVSFIGASQAKAAEAGNATGGLNEKEGADLANGSTSGSVAPEQGRLRSALQSDPAALESFERGAAGFLRFASGPLVEDWTGLGHELKGVEGYALAASKGWRHGELCDTRGLPLFGKDCSRADLGRALARAMANASCSPDGGRPIGYCPDGLLAGGCNSTRGPRYSVNDSDPDGVERERLARLEALGSADPAKLFIGEDCLGYATPAPGEQGPGGSEAPDWGGPGGPGGPGSGPGAGSPSGSDPRLIACCERLLGGSGKAAMEKPTIFEVNDAFRGGDVITVMDCRSRESLRVKALGVDDYHADVVPLTKDDTQALRRIRSYSGTFYGWCEGGGSSLWERRPLNAMIKGRNIAASWHGCPHAGAIDGHNFGEGATLSSHAEPNDYPGHFCIHFLKSRTHAGEKEDPKHQAAVEEAARGCSGMNYGPCSSSPGELCCRGPGLEREVPIDPSSCGIPCEELCDLEHPGQGSETARCKEGCRSQAPEADPCKGKEEESACTAQDGGKGLCCAGACAPSALICPSRAESCSGKGDGAACSVGSRGGVCCSGLCEAGAASCRICEQRVAYARNNATGSCEPFPTPCDVPEGWAACEGPACPLEADGSACAQNGRAGACCGGRCAAGAAACGEADGSGCAGGVDGAPCTSRERAGACCGGRCAVGASSCGPCASEGARAEDPATGNCTRFASACDVPAGWSPCIEDACRTACTGRFPSNPSLVDACAGACASTDVACERSCLGRVERGVREVMMRCLAACSHVGQEDWASTAVTACEEGCLGSAGEEMCVRLCRALAPRLEVGLSVLRGGSVPDSLFVGEEATVHATAANVGPFAFLGSVELGLRSLSSCSCPTCPDGVDCPCRCDERYERIGRLDDLLLMQGATSEGAMPFLVHAGLEGATVQPVAVVRDGSSLEVARVFGRLHPARAPGPMTVHDGYFSSVGSGNTTSAYPGETVQGAVVLSSERSPAVLLVELVDWRGEAVPGSGRRYELAAPVAAGTFATERVEVGRGLAGFVLHIRYTLSDGKGTVLSSSTLDEQGIPPERCRGRLVTSWCEERLARVRQSYPLAYLEVRAPELVVEDALFEDEEGLALARSFGPFRARASVDLLNPLDREFRGTVEAEVISGDGSRVPGTLASRAASLGELGRATLVTGGFEAAPGGRYRVWVRARDASGTSWLDAVADPVLHPFAELAVDPLPTEGEGRRPILTTVVFRDCRLSIECDGCLPTCELRIDPARCTPVARNCQCPCRSEALA